MTSVSCYFHFHANLDQSVAVAKKTITALAFATPDCQ